MQSQSHYIEDGLPSRHNKEQPTLGVIQIMIDPFLIKHHENSGEIPSESPLPSTQTQTLSDLIQGLRV